MHISAATTPHGAIACATWSELLHNVAQFFELPSDPFVTDTLLVPSHGHGRYIAQHLSHHLGGPAGVAAGIDFATADQLVARLLGDDPWAGPAFDITVADLLADAPGWAPGNGLGFARYAAGLLRGYWHHCPSMLQDWAAGEFTGPDGAPLPPSNTWQPLLWQALCARLPFPDPVTARVRAADLLTGGRTGAVLVAPPPPLDRPLIDALLERGSPVWALRPAPDDSWPRYAAAWPAGWPVAATTPVAGGSLLASVQSQLTTGQPAGERVADASIQIHASHGPNRQVQVLRDALCAVFDELGDLEPRDVLVLCPDLDVYAPLLQAAFGPSSSHPANALRLAAPQRQENWLVTGLIDVLTLGHHRATADELAYWCRHRGVVQRFGLTPDDLDRLGDLLAQAGVVWGVDGSQRAAAGLAARDGTWLDGVQKLLLALATDDVLRRDPPVVPASGVRSEDADLIGVLAELVSRLRRALLEAAQPAPLRVWAERLAQTAADLFAPDDSSDWCWQQLNEQLAKWSRHPADVPLASDDVVLLLDKMASRRGRSTDGNGDMVVRALGQLQGVSFRVVCVVGLDDASFPTRATQVADDLLAAAGQNDDRQRSRAWLRDALLAAGDAFIVVTRGADERTGATLPAPVVILDLLALCGFPGQWQPNAGAPSIVRRHALQPYAWPAFVTDGDHAPTSYDARALLSARRLSQPAPPPAPPGWKQLGGAATAPGPLTIDDIESCLSNPARYLLRQACGLVLVDAPPPADGQLATELDALGRWTIGQTLFDDLVTGSDQATARARALALPGCPPGRLGTAEVDRVMVQASDLAGAVLACGDVDDTVAVDSVLDGVRVSGSVALRGGTVVVARYGRQKTMQLLSCWVRLLAASASGRLLTGQVISTSGRLQLTAPDAERAGELLGQIAQLVARAAHELVPLPVETSAALMGVIGGPPDGANRSQTLRKAAADAFNGRFGEGRHPSWQMLLGTASLPELERVGPPGLAQLSDWLWRPVIAALRGQP